MNERYAVVGPLELDNIVLQLENKAIKVDGIAFKTDAQFITKARLLNLPIIEGPGKLVTIVKNKTAYICSTVPLKAPKDCRDMFNFHRFGYSYTNCNVDIRKVDMANLDTSGVMNMSYMFHDPALENINVNGMSTESVKCAYRMFRMCKKLESLDIAELHFKRSCDTGEIISYCNPEMQVNLGKNKICNQKLWVERIIKSLLRSRFVRNHKIVNKLAWGGFFEAIQRAYNQKDIEEVAVHVDYMLIPDTTSRHNGCLNEHEVEYGDLEW